MSTPAYHAQATGTGPKDEEKAEIPLDAEEQERLAHEAHATDAKFHVPASTALNDDNEKHELHSNGSSTAAESEKAQADHPTGPTAQDKTREAGIDRTETEKETSAPLSEQGTGHSLTALPTAPSHMNSNNSQLQARRTVSTETSTSPSQQHAPISLAHLPEYAEHPPLLPYNAWHHKKGILIFWFLILAECCFIPVSIYYGLWFGTTIRHGALFAIITSVFGFVTGYEYFCRGYLLLVPPDGYHYPDEPDRPPKGWSKEYRWYYLTPQDEYRPLNSSPRFWGMDSLHWLLVTPYTVLTGVLIGGSIPHEPLTRILAMPMALGNIILGVFFVVNGIAVQRKWEMKWRMSSHPKGSTWVPLTFCITEDAVAVDGRGKKIYREMLWKRYYASPRFRRMLLTLVWFWGVPSICVGAAVLAIIFTVKKEVAYGIGWVVPNIWAVAWVVLTVIWVRRQLRIEKENWVSDRERLKP